MRTQRACGTPAEAAGERLREHLRRKTREHYDRFPLEFLPPDAEPGSHGVQPASFLVFADAHLRGARRVLDVGCGPGRALVFLETLGARPVGCDLSGESLRLAAGRARRSDLAQADCLHLPFHDGAFAAVVCDGVLHHTPSAREGFGELARVLQPGGVMYVAVYKRARHYYYLYHYPGALLRRLHRSAAGRAFIRSAVMPFYHAVHLVKSRGARTRAGSCSFFHDYFLTPQATFHTRREVTAWGEWAGLALLRYDRNPAGNCHAFTFRKAADRRT